MNSKESFYMYQEQMTVRSRYFVKSKLCIGSKAYVGNEKVNEMTREEKKEFLTIF